jgi:hypothetical protein
MERQQRTAAPLVEKLLRILAALHTSSAAKNRSWKSSLWVT